MSNIFSNPDRPARVPEPSLAGGLPFHHAFLAGLLVVPPGANEDAKNRFAAISAFDPETVTKCEGMSPEDARTAFEEIEKRMG